MHRPHFRNLLAALLVLPSAVIAATPAAPTVTVGAAGIKQFQFDVTPVAAASYYELWFLPNGAATWVKYMTTLEADPVFKVSVSAHLLDWHNARYRVTACNADGCSSSAKIAMTNLMTDTVGYFKPRAAKVAPFAYGQSVTVSADGKTLVVLTGESIGGHKHSANAYVYEKSDTGWRRTARLLPTTVQTGTVDLTQGTVTTPRQLSINADGTTIVLGVPREYAPAGNLYQAGAVYVFHKSGTAWALGQKIGPSGVFYDQLGSIVEIDAQGQTLAVWRGNGSQGDASRHAYVQIYRRGASGFAPTLRVAPAVGVMNFDMSGDGKVLAVFNSDRSADVYTGTDFTTRQMLTRIDVRSTRLNTIATNLDGGVIALETMSGPAPAGQTWQPLVMAFRRGSSGWVAEPAFTYLTGQPTLHLGWSHDFASALAVSDDGKFIAAGDPSAWYDGTGALYPPVTATDPNIPTGALFVFERKPSSWALRNLIKPNVSTDFTGFASALAFGDNNRVLAVAAPWEFSGARDIDGDPTDTSGPTTGAMWLY